MTNQKFIVVLLILVAVGLGMSPLSTWAAPPPPGTEPQPKTIEALQIEAINQAITQRLNDRGAKKVTSLPFEVAIDHVEFISEEDRALVFLAPVDPDSGEILATEPILAIARSRDTYDSQTGAWEITLQSDENWGAQVKALPADMLTAESLQQFMAAEEPVEVSNEPVEKAAAAATYGGYRLPWAAGLSKRLTMGAYHVSCPNTCRYAFDFSDSTMFPLLAAKGGSIFFWKDTCANGDPSCTNSLVIEDKSTTPTTYQIYLHQRQGSIPERLKVKGAPVNQGDYIGDVDDTGYSTGHHLHFMVTANIYYNSGSDYWWGSSVDITFMDVPINWDTSTQGGRPCTKTDVTMGYCLGSQWQTSYTSSNQGSNLPSGGLTLPHDGFTISAPTVQVEGWGSDDLSVAKLQVLAKYDDIWREVGPTQTSSPFSFPLDLCAAGIPDGPVSLALRLWDYEGNQSIEPLGIRNTLKNYPCSPPPPACTPSANQVALYAEPNFSGACKVFDLRGEGYKSTELGAVGNDKTASIQVGANVQAVLFDGTDFNQRTETFIQSDRNLADNLLISRRVSSLKVQERGATPAAPTLQNPWAEAGVSPPTTVDSIILAWEAGFTPGGGSTEYQARITGPAGFNKTLSWQPLNSWSIGSLITPGTYTWQVWGRNRAANQEPVPSEPVSFTVSAATLPNPQPSAVPFEARMEINASAWTTSGMWHLAQVSSASNATTNAYVFNNIGDNGIIYGAGTFQSGGDLTSPPISVPASGAWLRFDYLAETEDSNPYWDQRRVQISANGGAFLDLLQLSGDAKGTWLQSPAIDLSAYKGQTVRIRFHFNTIDLWSNRGSKGWYIDNVTVNSTPPPVCSDPNESSLQNNNTPAQATLIQFGETRQAQICSNGDLDYYRFTASAGQRIGIDLDAASLTPASPLDTLLELLDSDGRTVLAENDDEVQDVRTDSTLSFLIPANGSYYARVKAWDHPSSGGPGYNYRLKLVTDSGQPTLSLETPLSSSFLSSAPTHFKANPNDPGGSGVRNVEFLWHSPDWIYGQWTLLGSDWDGADGWSLPFNPSSYPEGKGYALLARAYDFAGNTASAVAWNLGIDRMPPQTSLNSLPATIYSTAVLLQWSANDSLSGLSHFDLQFTDNGGSWQTYPQAIAGNLRQYWFIGEMGHTYTFRLRGVDHSGNAEAFPALLQARTSIAFCNPDSLEKDDILDQARLLTTASPDQKRNFCGTSDEDWSWFEAVAGENYVVRVTPGSGSAAAPQVTLFDASGSPLGVEFTPGALGNPALFQWQATSSGRVYLRMRSLDARVAGDAVDYTPWAGKGQLIYLPTVGR